MEKSSRKRASTAEGSTHDHIKAIIVDFDESIVPSSFIKEKLYGFVKDNCADYLSKHLEENEVKAVLESLKKEAGDGLKEVPEGTSDEELVKIVAENVKVLLNKAEDSCKVEKLVALILRDGIERKEVVVELHDDVAPAIKEWVDKKVKVIILSSKSVELQKLLLFANKSDDFAEDDVHFETFDGHPKSVKETYAKVADKIKFTPGDVLFVTTSPHEARAASAAGLEAVLLKRSGETEQKDEAFVTISELKGVFHVSHPEATPQKVSRQQAPTAVHN